MTLTPEDWRREYLCQQMMRVIASSRELTPVHIRNSVRRGRTAYPPWMERRDLQDVWLEVFNFISGRYTGE